MTQGRLTIVRGGGFYDEAAWLDVEPWRVRVAGSSKRTGRRVARTVWLDLYKRDPVHGWFTQLVSASGALRADGRVQWTATRAKRGLPALVDEYSYLFEWLREQLAQLRHEGEYSVASVEEVGFREPGTGVLPTRENPRRGSTRRRQKNDTARDLPDPPPEPIPPDEPFTRLGPVEAYTATSRDGMLKLLDGLRAVGWTLPLAQVALLLDVMQPAGAQLQVSTFPVLDGNPRPYVTVRPVGRQWPYSTFSEQEQTALRTTGMHPAPAVSDLRVEPTKRANPRARRGKMRR